MITLAINCTMLAANQIVTSLLGTNAQHIRRME